MLKEGLSETIVPSIKKISSILKANSKKFASLPMLSRTHGQTASQQRSEKNLLISTTE